MVEGLLEELQQRIAAAADGDTDSVLGEQALALADQLTRESETEDGAWPAEVLHGIALLRTMRYLCGGADEDRMTALVLLAELRMAVPQLAPDDLLALLGATATDAVAALGASLLRQAQERARRELLDRAIDILRENARATPEDDPNRAARLSNLSLAYRIKAERHGDRADLDLAVTAGQQAVAACGDDGDRPGCLANLADALHTCFERDGDAESLDRAMHSYQAAAEAAPPGHPLHDVLLGKLGAALTARYTLSGVTADLDESIRLCAQASQATAGGEFAAQAQANLASALAIRGAETGSLADLGNAIAAGRAAVESTGPEGAAASTRWLNLAAALYDRYQIAGAAGDLDGAVAAARAALSAATVTEDSPVYLGMLLANVSILLRIRGERDGDAADMGAALAAARQSLALCPAGHPARADRVNNLGTALLARYEHREAESAALEAEDKDIEEGIHALTKAGAGTGSRLSQARLLSTLGLLLLRRFQRNGAAADLDAALNAAANSVSAYPAQHSAAAGAALNLGSVYREAFGHRRRRTDLDGAIASWRSGADADGSPASLRLACARQWGEFAAAERSWTLAAEGYAQAVALLPYVCWRGLNRTDQEHALLAYATVAADAAAAAAAAGELSVAAGQLEHGRAVLWTQQLEMRDSLAALRATRPALAAALDRTRRALDSTALDRPLTVPSGMTSGVSG